jgi:hypothetical protein
VACSHPLDPKSTQRDRDFHVLTFSRLEYCVLFRDSSYQQSIDPQRILSSGRSTPRSAPAHYLAKAEALAQRQRLCTLRTAGAPSAPTHAVACVHRDILFHLSRCLVLVDDVADKSQHTIRSKPINWYTQVITRDMELSHISARRSWAYKICAGRLRIESVV